MENIFIEIEKFGKKIALIDEFEHNITYDELINLSRKMTENIPENALVFSLCDNTLHSIAFYVGCIRKGIKPLLLSNNIKKSILEELISKYKPTSIFLSAKLPYFISEYHLIFKKKNMYILSSNNDSKTIIFNEISNLLSTSGSTGSPKLVIHSKRNVISNTQSIVEYLGISNNDVAITSLPMSYTYGLSIINTHLYAGATLILTNSSILSNHFWNLVSTHKATTFGGVPYTYEILKKISFTRLLGTSIQYLTQAGGKIDPELARELVSFCSLNDIKFIVMYGQTEATARMSYLPWEYAKNKPSSIGVAIPGGKFSIIDENSRYIETIGSIGELIYEGDNVSPGYSSCLADLVSRFENRRILHTGDMAYFDSDGFYYIAGRKKRFLKIYGYRVSLDELENKLKENSFDCVCLGKDDNLNILTINRDLNEIYDFIVHNTQINPLALNIKEISDYPRFESGKIDYEKLHEYI